MIASETARISSAGNGATTAFSVPFYFLDNSHIKAILLDANGVETTWVENTDYTLSGAGNPNGGTLTATTAPATGETLVILRNIPLDQQTDYINNDKFAADTHEDGLDRLVMIAQQLEERLDRSPQLKETSSKTGVQMDDPEDGKVLVGDSSGNLANKTITDLGTLQTPASVIDEDIVVFDGTGGEKLKAGAKKISDLQDVSEKGAANGYAPLDSAGRSLASDLPVGFSRKNLLINANPLINQRGYVSGTNTTGANEYTLDRWRVVTSGQALTFSTSENVVTLTLPVGGIEQVIEGLNIQSGTHTISFVATGDTVCTVDGVTKVSGDTFTLTGGTNATLKFSSAAGTGTVKLIQVEKGSVATDFEHRSYGQELALCQRYTYVWSPGENYSNICLVRGESTTLGVGIHFFPIEMRIKPSLATSGNFRIVRNGNNTSTATLGISPNQGGRSYATIRFTTSSISTNELMMASADNDSSAKIVFDSEL